jgi:O-antigen ligase
LVIVAHRREQVWAMLVTVSAGALAALAAAPFRGVTALAGAQSTRERQGAVTLGLLIVVGLLTAIVQWRLVRHERAAELRLPSRAPLIAVVAICVGLALAIVVGAKESSTVARPLSAGATRYETLQSDRYAYWRVALRAFADEPLRGVGAGGWAVYWLRLRRINEGAQDAHSLPLQTAAELGLVGLALLAAFLAGVALAARDASRIAVARAAGPIAGCVVYVAHAPLDWDWQMPAVTLVALILAGALLAQSELTTPRRSAALRG